MKLGRRFGAAGVAAVLSVGTPSVGQAAAPEPIEQELFESWVGKYTDITTAELLRHFGVGGPRDPGRLGFAPSKAEYYDQVAKALGLGKVAKDKLEKNGVVLVDDPRSFSMAAAYYELYTKDLPLLVTTDSILDAMHRSFDGILAELEERLLRDALMRSLRKVQAELPALAKTTPALAEAAGDLDLYLSVALNLLEADPDNGTLLTAPKLVQPDEVKALLAKAAAGKLENPGFGTDATTLYGERRAIDWSQLAPRGHYTKTPRLSQYFRALMWLGRADTAFLLEKPRQLRAAALLTHTLEATGAAKDMQIMKDVVDLMVGRSDDLTPAQLADVMRREKLASPADLVDPARLARLADALAASGLGRQRIKSQLLVSNPTTADKVVPPPIFQPFGQRFVIDSFVLSKVVYDDIVFEGQKQNRRMPTGLDVMAALGSDIATRLLAAPGGELDTWNYGANLAALRDVIGAWTEATWQDNLYSMWVDALRTLSEKPNGQHVPAVMSGDAWEAKTLQTQLASWAQLRHDTILYAKQSYTVSLGCLYPQGYVEPYPAFYAKLGAFAAEASRRFAALGNDTSAYRAYFDNFAKTMKTLEGIANKELSGKPLSKDDDTFLGNTIERQMTGGGYAPEPDWSGWYVDLVYAGSQGDAAAVDWKPTIADVHTDPDTFTVLEVGTADVDFAVVAIDNDGDTAIHVGPTFSYYEFTHPVNDRLTNEAWSQMLTSGKAPARPDWVTWLLAPPGR